VFHRVREAVLAEVPEDPSQREFGSMLHRSCSAGPTKWKSQCPDTPELNGTLTSRFGGNAFFICLFHGKLDAHSLLPIANPSFDSYRISCYHFFVTFWCSPAILILIEMKGI
jgi:hypothetical protein